MKYSNIDLHIFWNCFFYIICTLQETDIIDDVNATENEACEDVVKSDEAPYIIQEKDVLEKIRIVDEAKRKFSQQM